MSVATEDVDSQVCLVSARDDDSLSSVEDTADMVDDAAARAPLVVQPPSDLIWGTPGTSPLYQAMQSLVGTARADTCRLETPSAARADELSHQLHQQVDTLMEQHGTEDQKQLWKNASHDQQHEWIAAFFLAALS